MKYALIFLMLIIYTCTSAQVVRKAKKNDKTDNGRQMGSERIVPPGTYAMAPDNMPCVVPDMSTVTRMPNNFKTGDTIPFMPNALRRTPISMIKTTDTRNK